MNSKACDLDVIDLAGLRFENPNVSLAPGVCKDSLMFKTDYLTASLQTCSKACRTIGKGFVGVYCFTLYKAYHFDNQGMYKLFLLEV